VQYQRSQTSHRRASEKDQNVPERLSDRLLARWTADVVRRSSIDLSCSMTTPRRREARPVRLSSGRALIDSALSRAAVIRPPPGRCQPGRPSPPPAAAVAPRALLVDRRPTCNLTARPNASSRFVAGENTRSKLTLHLLRFDLQ